MPSHPSCLPTHSIILLRVDVSCNIKAYQPIGPTGRSQIYLRFYTIKFRSPAPQTLVLLGSYEEKSGSPSTHPRTKPLIPTLSQNSPNLLIDHLLSPRVDLLPKVAFPLTTIQAAIRAFLKVGDGTTWVSSAARRRFAA